MYCTLFFCIVQKVFFGLYNRKASRQRLTLHDIADIYTHGIRSDFIIASYMTAIPLIVSALSTLIPFINAGTVLSIYNAIISLAVALICVSDTLLYKFWGYKLDSSAFVYLRSLKGTFASVSTTYIVCAMTLVVLCAALFLLGAEFITLKYASLQHPGFPWIENEAQQSERGLLQQEFILQPLGAQSSLQPNLFPQHKR